MFSLVQAFGGRDQEREVQDTKEKEENTSGSSEEIEEKGSKAQEKGLP